MNLSLLSRVPIVSLKVIDCCFVVRRGGDVAGRFVRCKCQALQGQPRMSASDAYCIVKRSHLHRSDTIGPDKSDLFFCFVLRVLVGLVLLSRRLPV